MELDQIEFEAGQDHQRIKRQIDHFLRKMKSPHDEQGH